MNQTVKDFGKGFKQLGNEISEKLVEETGKIAESIITAKELLGDIKSLSEEEIAQKKTEEERKKQKEISDIRSQISGREVENEMEKIRHQKQKEEEEKEKMFLENLKRKREEEKEQQITNFEMMGNFNKHQKDKGGNKRKKQEPDLSQLSQTSEIKGKID